MRWKNNELERNQIMTTSSLFMESYNKGIPVDFPRASAGLMKQFQDAHPVLFREGNEWSIDKHRKRFMDWLSSHRDIS